MLVSRTHELFDDYADRYDTWYDAPRGRALFAAEVGCLRPLLERFPRPYLEVGVGTGRFAQALGVGHGLEPARQLAFRARGRGVETVQGLGEQLPFRDGSFGAVLLAFTLCFVRDPASLIGEARRVLARRGGLVLGLLPKGTPWADFYARQGAEGHSVYRAARFYSTEEVMALLAGAGFQVVAQRSTLFQRPGLDAYRVEQPVDGYVLGSGFVGVAAVRAGLRLRR